MCPGAGEKVNTDVNMGRFWQPPLVLWRKKPIHKHVDDKSRSHSASAAKPGPAPSVPPSATHSPGCVLHKNLDFWPPNRRDLGSWKLMGS